MRRINLLPTEDQPQGLSSIPEATLGYFAIAATAIVVLIAVLGLLLFLRLSAIDNTVARLDSDIGDQTQRLQQLQPYSELEGEVANKQPVANGIVRTRFSWDEFLRQLSFVIPSTTSLQSLTAESAPVDIDASVGQQPQPPGAVTFLGFAEPDFTNVADFVIQMDTLDTLANSGIVQAELDRTTFAEEAIQFEVNSELVTIVGERESEVRLESDESAASEAQYQSQVGSVGEPVQ